MYIKCRFLDQGGNPKGREYTYAFDGEIEPGTYVSVVNPQMEKSKVIVTEVDVPAESVAAFADKIKTAEVWRASTEV